MGKLPCLELFITGPLEFTFQIMRQVLEVQRAQPECHMFLCYPSFFRIASFLELIFVNLLTILWRQKFELRHMPLIL